MSSNTSTTPEAPPTSFGSAVQAHMSTRLPDVRRQLDLLAPVELLGVEPRLSPQRGSG